MRRFNNKFTRNALAFHNGPRNLAPAEVFAVVMQRHLAIQTEDVKRSAARSYRDREFVADVELTARRILSPNQYTLFRLCYIWRRSNEFILRQRIGYKTALDIMLVREAVERLLGTAFKDTKPYPLYPLKEYFRDPELKKREAVHV